MGDTMIDKIICVFAKPPAPGRTKQRMAAVIGDNAAAELSAAMLKDIAEEVANVNNCRFLLFHSPDSSAKDFIGLIPGCFEFVSQQGAELGERMNNAFELLFEQYNNPHVLLIGSDCIGTSVSTLEAAFSVLKTHKVVIQPASDGGYVLVGQSTMCNEIFCGIDWGTAQVMQQTLSQLKRYNINYQLLPESFDIDEFEDLPKLHDFVSANARPATAKALRSITLK